MKTTYHVEVGIEGNLRHFWIAETLLPFRLALSIARLAVVSTDRMDFLVSQRPALQFVNQAADRGEKTWARVVNSQTGSTVASVQFTGHRRTSVYYHPGQPLYHTVATLLANEAFSRTQRAHVVRFLRADPLFKNAHAPIP